LEKENTVLHYKGAIEYETVNTLIRQLQDEFSRRNYPITLYKRILVVMIELLENIYKYCDPQCLSEFSDNSYPEILIQRNKDHFIIRASNPLLNKHRKKLEKRLDILNSLNRSGLMEAYKKTITNGTFTEKGGAGLGLLEIAKISALPLKYSFTSIDDSHTMYMIEVAIDK
jgi:hypothetical protein